jgi:hypothetical protein
MGVAARVRWTPGGDCAVVFRLGTIAELALGNAFVQIESHPFHEPGRGQQDFLPEVERIFPDATGQRREMFRLLDVSSRADLFGVGYSPVAHVRDAGGSLTLRGLDLVASLHDVSAFVLPAFQWEAVYDIPNPKALPGFPPKLLSATDGGPTRFGLVSARLAPLAPIPVLDSMVSEYNSPEDLGEGPRLAVRLTLPFGIVAAAELRRTRNPFIPMFDSPHFDSVRPMFTGEGYEGGRQVSLTPAFQLVQVAGGPRGPAGYGDSDQQRHGGVQRSEDRRRAFSFEHRFHLQ